MRILMIVNRYMPMVGGVEKHVECLSHSLITRGHSVSVLTGVQDCTLSLNELIDGVSVRRVKFNQNKIIRLIQCIIYQYKLLGLFKSYDIIHVHDYVQYYKWLLFIHLFIKKKIVITFHGYEGFPLKTKDILLRKFVASRCNPRINVGHFISKWYGTPSEEVIYGGVDAEAQNGQERQWGAIFVGRIEKDTSLEKYIRGISIFQRNINKLLPIDIFGQGGEQECINQLAMDLGVKVNWRGWDKKASKYISRYTISFASGYLSILESIAAGAYVITTFDNDLKRDYLKLWTNVTTSISICESAEEVAEAINIYANFTNSENHIYSKKYEKIVEDYSWGTLADTHERLYKLALGLGG